MAYAFRSLILEETGSTNAEAFKHAEAGEAGPLWIMALRQTEGRGRSGRRWTSDRGNLYASRLQRLQCPQSNVHQLSLLTGVAVVEAIAVAAQKAIPGLRLKWPNDVLIGRDKCAGILAESQSWGQRSEIVIVLGIGINLASHPTDAGQPVTHLAAHGVTVMPETMLAALAASTDRWIEIWDGGVGFERVRTAWLEHGSAVGERLTINTGRERIAGTFLGLDGSGALLLRDEDGTQRTLAYGDVTVTAPDNEGRD